MVRQPQVRGGLRLGCRSQCPLGDVGDVNLRRTLVDAKHSDVTVEALGHVSRHVAFSAEQLHRAVSHSTAHL